MVQNLVALRNCTELTRLTIWISVNATEFGTERYGMGWRWAGVPTVPSTSKKYKMLWGESCFGGNHHPSQGRKSKAHKADNSKNHCQSILFAIMLSDTP